MSRRMCNGVITGKVEHEPGIPTECKARLSSFLPNEECVILDVGYKRPRSRFWEGDGVKRFSLKKSFFSEKGGGIQ